MLKKNNDKLNLFSEMFKKYGIDAGDIEAYVVTDLSKPGTYGKTVVFVSGDAICTLSEDGSFVRKSFAEIDDIYTENYVSSGELILSARRDDLSLAHFTLSISAEMEKFITVARKLINGETVTEIPQLGGSDATFKYINNGRKKLFFRVLSYVPRYKKHLFLMILTIILSTVINVIPPYLTGRVLYDEVLTLGGKYYGQLLPLVSLLVMITIVSVLLAIFLGRVGAELSGNIIFDIKTEVFSSMQKLGMRFFSSKRTGNLLNRINSDALDIQYFLNDGLPNFIINGATIAVIGLFLFIVNPLLSISVLIPVPLIAVIVKKSTRKFKKLKWHTWRKSSSLNSLINDNLQGVRVVKAFGKEERELLLFNIASKELCDNRIREGIASAKVFPILNWIMSVGGLVIWALGGAQILSGSLSFGELMSFVAYLSLLYTPVSFMVKTFDWWTACMNSAQRIFEVIDREPDVVESDSPVHIEKLRGDIELKNVSFSYEANTPVLKNVSFKVNSGEMIGLVGHSGAGKSTITNIITRLYDVNDGEVLIDGVNIKNLSFDTLHRNIGIVLQETFLFSGTIAENIAYGNPSASMEKIIEAAKKAEAHDFINMLPDGYETRIGKNGSDLSGGEKQRISIARAILMNPAILIFDEATSSLDTNTEQKIQRAMDHLVKNRTTIAIAHRFSTLKNADRLVVVEKGKIVETGTHEELFEKPDGVYAKMAHLQLNALSFAKEEGE